MTNKRKSGIGLTAALFAGASCLSIAAPASAESFAVLEGGGFANIEIESMRERKFATTVRQQYDFSCGSAAVATLLTHHYDRPTSETDAFASMWAVGDQSRIQQVGFSLLEMKAYLESLGYEADGFRLGLDRVKEIGVPGIALIDVKGYKHFVVIKGITDRTVLFGDPSKGMLAKSRKDFEKIWDGVILFIRSDVAQGRANFNDLDDWRAAPGSPSDRGLDRVTTLAEEQLLQTRTSASGFALGTTFELTGSN